MDGYIFNAPFVKYISIIALFLDPKIGRASCRERV